jgi:hypothetical protein
MPAPAATPLTAAITGLGSSRSAMMSGLYSSVRTRRKARSALPPRRSAPLQKPRPSPVMTTARTASSRVAALRVASSSPRIAALSAFRLSGRLSVMEATPSPSSYRIVS